MKAFAARFFIACEMAVRREALGVKENLRRPVGVQRSGQRLHSHGNFGRHARSRRYHADPALFVAHSSGPRALRLIGSACSFLPMFQPGDYFFCGIGGSGMTPLALIIQARGGRVEGSDRALDQGRNAEKFDFLRARGVLLHPQDGSGMRRADQILVTSAAVEETVLTCKPRVVSVPLSQPGQGFSPNSSTLPPGHWRCGDKRQVDYGGHDRLDSASRRKEPTIMNGADMKNFVGAGSTFRQRSDRRRRGVCQ
jgi:hypothetical protein